MMGATFGSKEVLLAGVSQRFGVPAEKVDSDSADSNQNSELDEQQDTGVLAGDERGSGIPTLSLHRGMYAPIVRLPPIIGSSDVHHLSRQTTSSFSLEPEDPLIPSDNDEEALAAELQDEEDLDVQDAIEAQNHENLLWGEYGRRRTGAHVTSAKEAAIEGVEDAHAHALRFKPPGIDGNVKSKVYIEDSD